MAADLASLIINFAGFSAEQTGFMPKPLTVACISLSLI